MPGSFQSELGCAADWDPGCLRSWLQDPDGDGVGRFATTALPAGTYEGKVAIDEAWDENYGAGGVFNGPNISFVVGNDGDTVEFVYNQSSHVLDITVTPQEPVDDAALVQEPVRHPFVDEVLYFAIPDRFFDGNRRNNCGDYEGRCVANDTQANVLTHGYLPSDKGYYHGGDIAGLRQRLPYLDDLGITAIWVGPIFANKPVQSDTTNLYGHSSGYHGYWIEDFLRVDPHLGTNEEFAAAGPRRPPARHPGVHGRRHQPHRRRHPARGRQRLPQQGDVPVHRRERRRLRRQRLRLRRAGRLLVPAGRPVVVPVHADGAARRGRA